MILVLMQPHHGSTEFTPAMRESTGFMPGLSPVAGKTVIAAFDGGRLTSDAGILVLAGALHRGPARSRAHPAHVSAEHLCGRSRAGSAQGKNGALL
jgi:hypothetical protein